MKHNFFKYIISNSAVSERIINLNKVQYPDRLYLKQFLSFALYGLNLIGIGLKTGRHLETAEYVEMY